jgi:hypothetical protein
VGHESRRFDVHFGTATASSSFGSASASNFSEELFQGLDTYLGID